ncbi:MAG: SDR family NAD(P)-dependent oxidoreductase [Hyphomicrobiales bacterium]
MPKTILITGATDGIGLETAKLLSADGHHFLVHGRSPAKLDALVEALPDGAHVEAYLADFSNLDDVMKLASDVAANHTHLDVLINNAGVYKTPNPVMSDGSDVRFVVNTIAPYLLTKRLLPLMDANGRVVNLSSAAQAPVNLDALAGKAKVSDMEAYAQSKLAITAWSRAMAQELGSNGPVVVAVNPGSLLASKMVKEGFGVEGSDLSIGAGILVRAALSDEFAEASGKYFDNDSGQFAPPHPEGLDDQKNQEIVRVVEAALAGKL